MNTTRSVLLLLLTSCIWGGCKKDDINVFDENNYVYVNLAKVAGKTYAQSSFTFTFSDASVQEKKLTIPVKFAGRFAGKARTFTVGVIDSLTTARQGVHYVLQASQQIEAGKDSGSIIVNLKRTPDMKTVTFELMLQLKSDESFKSGHIDMVKVIISDRLIQPDWWNLYARFLGTYSDLKCRLWLEFMNITDGSDPWSISPYSKVVFNGLAYVNVPNDAPIKSSMISFKTWLINVKQNPFDPMLNMQVSASLGDASF